MKGKRVVSVVVILVVVAAVIAAVLSVLHRRAEEDTGERLVAIEGVGGCWNASLCYCSWVAVPVEGRPAVLALRDGDMVFTSMESGGERKNEDIFFPYLASDGLALSLKRDEYRLLEDGATISLELSDDERGRRWLEEAEDEELARLRFVEVGPEVTAVPVDGLSRLAQVNPRICLALGSQAAVRHVLPLFQPRWLALPDAVTMEAEDLNIITSRKGLEVLWIDLGNARDLEFLTQMDGLRRLVISGWDPDDTGPFPEDCKNIEELVLNGGEMEDLSPVAHLANLKRLHLFECRLLEDVSAIAKLTSLRSLAIRECNKLTDLLPLKGLPDLKRLSLPEPGAEEHLGDLAAAFPALRELELIDCSLIEDITALKGLTHLESLVLPNCNADLTPLGQMKALRYLVLPEEVFEEAPEQIRSLEKELPGCTITAGTSFCLGSGWILLLVPLVVLAYLLMRGSRRPVNA